MTNVPRIISVGILPIKYVRIDYKVNVEDKKRNKQHFYCVFSSQRPFVVYQGLYAFIIENIDVCICKSIKEFIPYFIRITVNIGYI